MERNSGVARSIIVELRSWDIQPGQIEGGSVVTISITNDLHC